MGETGPTRLCCGGGGERGAQGCSRDFWVGSPRPRVTLLVLPRVPSCTRGPLLVWTGPCDPATAAPHLCCWGLAPGGERSVLSLPGLPLGSHKLFHSQNTLPCDSFSVRLLPLKGSANLLREAFRHPSRLVSTASVHSLPRCSLWSLTCAPKCADYFIFHFIWPDDEEPPPSRCARIGHQGELLLLHLRLFSGRASREGDPWPDWGCGRILDNAGLSGWVRAQGSCVPGLSRRVSSWRICAV